jgi:hypothetical protein
MTEHLHLVAEAAWFRHRPHGDTMLYTTLAMFAEAGYHLGDLTPYARFEHFDFGDGDPYFISSGIPIDARKILSAGAKYAASASVSIKVEGGADLESNHRHVLAQAAFAF